MATDAAKTKSLRDPDETVLDAEIERACMPFGKEPELIQPLRNKLQDIMWDYAGVVRTEQKLEIGLSHLAEVQQELMEIGVDASNLAFNLTWHDWLNMQSLCEMSEVITRASLARENSRGAHYREDFTETGSLEESYFTVARKKDTCVEVSREPVEFTIVKPGETLLNDDEPETLVAMQ